MKSSLKDAFYGEFYLLVQIKLVTLFSIENEKTVASTANENALCIIINFFFDNSFISFSAQK